MKSAGSRWDHGINAALYGAPGGRVDVSRFSPLASVIVGVYTSLANTATILKSDSLVREASNSPLMTDISRVAARAIRNAFVKDIVPVNPHFHPEDDQDHGQ